SLLSMNRVRKREQAPRTPNAAARWPSAWDFAKRLECDRLAGAFHGSWSQCMRQSERRLSMNRPTPDPSQEGSRHSSASCPIPSWEGLGVGSWSQCLRKNEGTLSMDRTPHRQVLDCLPARARLELQFCFPSPLAL